MKLSAYLLGAGATVALAAPVSTQCELTELLGSGVILSDFFVPEIAVSGDTAVIGARDDSLLGAEAGAVYVMRRVGATWTTEAVLRASDGAALDFFGQTVDIDGDTILVGARGDDDAGSFSGSAYVFTRSGVVWTEQAKLTASDAAASDQFGLGVAVEGDRALVAAPFDDNFHGSMYAFERSAGMWTETQKFGGSQSATIDLFGLEPRLAGDRLIVGCPDQNILVPVEFDAGAVYVFDFVGGQWTESAYIPNPTPGAAEAFGRGVDFEGDTLVVGTPYRDVGGADNVGVVYVFERIAGTWTQTALLPAPDGTSFDWFGLGLSLQGGDLLVGMPGYDGSPATSFFEHEPRGAVHRYRKTGATWTRVARLTPSDGETDDLFGIELAHAGDVAFAATSSVTDTGSAYVFGLDGSACSLGANNFEVSPADGDFVLFDLAAGIPFALRPYLLLGTTAGTFPGLTIAGVNLPLNVDGPAGFFVQTLTNPNQPPLIGSFGILDLNGRSTAGFNLPASVNRDPALVGLTLHFAYAVFDAIPGTPVFASNPVHVNLTD